MSEHIHTQALPLPPDLAVLPDHTIVLITVTNSDGDEGFTGCIIVTLEDATAIDPETGEVLPHLSGDKVRVLLPVTGNVFDRNGVFTGTFGI